VCFILEFYITQILIPTTCRFERISRLIRVTDNNGAPWKLEIETVCQRDAFWMHSHFQGRARDD
jgi:hypothetical protein